MVVVVPLEFCVVVLELPDDWFEVLVLLPCWPEEPEEEVPVVPDWPFEEDWPLSPCCVLWLCVEDDDGVEVSLSSRQKNSQRINQMTAIVTNANTASHIILPMSEGLPCSYIALPLAYIGTVSE